MQCGLPDHPRSPRPARRRSTAYVAGPPAGSVTENNKYRRPLLVGPPTLCVGRPVINIYSANTWQDKYSYHNIAKQGVALTGRNRTGPPCSVGHPTARSGSGWPPCARLARRQRYRRQTTPTTDNRRQRAKQYWPIRRASNKLVVLHRLCNMPTTRVKLLLNGREGAIYPTAAICKFHRHAVIVYVKWLIK